MRPSCCCCGQPLPPARHPFTRGRCRQVYDFVARHPQGVRIEEIFEHIWGNDPDGGPEGWRSLLHTTIGDVNDKLRALDLIVTRDVRGRHDTPYNLRRISTGNIWLPLWRE